uniref:Translationally-controlled tumor protein homolog n=1 Tax=Caenorhabditis japonica TaxID=281687 RepID=A0A2Q4QPW1_CAEJA
MLIYKDIFTDDEIASDSFPMKLVDDLIYEFKGRHVVRKEGEIVLAGSNPSAEEGAEDDGSDEHVERGIDIVLNHKLVEMNCYEDASMFKAYVKKFMKNVIDKMEENKRDKADVDAFKKKIQAWVVSLLAKDRFKNLAFFIGERAAEGAENGQVAIIEYRDVDGTEVPTLMLVKEAVVEEKC